MALVSAWVTFVDALMRYAAKENATDLVKTDKPHFVVVIHVVTVTLFSNFFFGI